VVQNLDHLLLSAVLRGLTFFCFKKGDSRGQW
jgi:hypothetical protein